MVASSSSGPALVEVLSTQSLLALASEPAPDGPLCVDKFVDDAITAPAAAERTMVAAPMAARSAPASPPLTSQAAPAQAFVDRGTQPALDVSSGEEYESGELDTSGSDEFSWHEGRARHVDAWVSPGRPELTEHLLFAFIEPSVPMADVSPFIRNALRLVDPLLPVDLLPSSRGAMLLRCESMSARDSLHRHNPISLHGTQLILQKPEETSNRFFRIPTWLAFVAVSDFPNEHWYEPKIKECFKGFSEVAEINPECLTGENFASLRLLLVVNDRLEIPFEMRISSRHGVGRDGAVAKIAPIRVWPREYQLDSQGNLARFFGPPAPPVGGPSLGPLGPISREQQVRPPQHYYSQMFPPLGTPGHGHHQAHNLQYAFDPLHASQPSIALHATLFASKPATVLPASQVLGLALALARLLNPPVVPVCPPAPPPSIASPISTASPSRSMSPSIITYRRHRMRNQARSTAPKRSSSRLAAKASGNFVDMTTQAVQRKALLNSLSGCSKTLKKHVTKRNILSRNMLPLGGAELRKLVSAAKLSCMNVDIVGVVTDVVE